MYRSSIPQSVPRYDPILGLVSVRSLSKESLRIKSGCRLISSLLLIVSRLGEGRLPSQVPLLPRENTMTIVTNELILTRTRLSMHEALPALIAVLVFGLFFYANDVWRNLGLLCVLYPHEPPAWTSDAIRLGGSEKIETFPSHLKSRHGVSFTNTKCVTQNQRPKSN